MTQQKKRLEYLRQEIKNERISQDEIVELQSLAEFIDPSDTLLLEWAIVPEFGAKEDEKPTPEATRLFFVVDSEDSNEEIFETLEEAENYRIKELGTAKGSRVYASVVKNAYQDPDTNQWNYEDHSTTFDKLRSF